MTLDALGPRSEAWFVDETVPLDVVAGLGRAVALRTPSDPSFRWGNLLVLAEPIAAGTRPFWEARFDQAFADLPEVRHRTFAWTGEDGALAELEAAGYDVDRNTVRLAGPNEVVPPGDGPAGFELAPVTSDADWQAVLTLHLEDSHGEDPGAYRLHRERRNALYRRIAAGDVPGLRGGWYLARLDGEPAGSMGVFVRGDLARFQFVHVAARHRRRGVATAMVRRVARDAFEFWGARQAAIMVDEGTPAEGIYARAGFGRIAERYVGACLASRTPAP
jgi:ribosomal protein S18 acetylase RimI-like enzyme